MRKTVTLAAALTALCMMTGAAVIVCNLLAQAISARIDPRLAGEEAAHG